MKSAARIFLLAALIASGCTTARKVAHTSFRVLDAPANYVRRQIDAQENSTTTTTTTTTSSDTVTTPGRTVTVPPPTTDLQRRDQTRPGPSPRSSPATVTERSKPSPSHSRSVTGQTQFPTAKPVPGKPGYVFSPFDASGGYVDVTGYSPGQKVKDPYSGKIFLVP
ncbi:MAG TPA: hypothetical protein VEX43_00450 [Chthoniobacterales bacterium]|nr:hypothetical protein [Chthoniobacterales bacterium]